MKKFVIGIFVLSLPAAAYAANWKEVATSVDNTIYYLDISSVRTVSSYLDSYKSAWLKLDESKNSRVSHRSSKVLYRVKCDTYEMGYAQWIDYDPQGRVVDSQTRPYVSYDVMAPESVGYSILSAICWGV